MAGPGVLWGVQCATLSIGRVRVHCCDRFGVRVRPYPRDGVAVLGYSPNNTLLPPCLCYIVGMVNINCPITSMLIKFGPRRRLNCESWICHCYHSPKNAKWASTTKSITSSVALTLKRSQNQSTAISDDAIVSNIKSCRSCRVWGEERSVFVMYTQYTIWGAFQPMVCHLVNWSGSRLSLYHLPPKCVGSIL